MARNDVARVLFWRWAVSKHLSYSRTLHPPAFNKEVDLAFPKPADAPDNAVFFVYRRLDGPDGRVVYESIDYADVEGEGANAKVVTKSYPFSGYVSSINGFNASGLDAGGAIGNGGVATNYTSHTYPTSRKIWETIDFYRELKDVLTTGSRQPN